MFGSIFGSVAGSVLGSVTSSLLGGGGGGGSSAGSGFGLTDLIGPALQIGGNLIGGKMQNDSNEEINAHNLRLAQDQLEFQRQYAHNRLQWQVEDAKKAGLHPMVAAGLSPVSFSPVSANLTPNNYDWVGNIGQSLNYAATKGKTRNQQAQMLDLQLQGLMLDNQYKQAQIDSLKVDTLAATIAADQAFRSPAAPDLNGGRTLVGGQGDSPVLGDTFAIRHIRDNDYDINFSKDYQGELGDEVGQIYNMVRKGTRENGAVWTDPKTGVAYVFNRSSGWWNRLDALSREEAERLLGSRHDPAFGHMPLSSSHRVRNSYRYR